MIFKMAEAGRERAGYECYHCKEWITPGHAHDCWTTTEKALTSELSEELQDAWERLRETAAGFGAQRIYASHNSIMFSKKACYFFVRPKGSYLEVCVFLGRPVKAPQLRRVVRSSSTKFAHLFQIRHRDEVEAPITDWLREAYETSDALTAQRPKKTVKRRSKTSAKSTRRSLAARRSARR